MFDQSDALCRLTAAMKSKLYTEYLSIEKSVEIPLDKNSFVILGPFEGHKSAGEAPVLCHRFGGVHPSL